MAVTGKPARDAECLGVGALLNRIGDKWTVQVIVALYDEPRRFNAIKRSVAGISQQMLARTLKALERDGMVRRNVHPTTPPQVDYELTGLGRSLAEPVQKLADWAVTHREAVQASQLRFDGEA